MWYIQVAVGRREIDLPFFCSDSFNMINLMFKLNDAKVLGGAGEKFVLSCSDEFQLEWVDISSLDQNVHQF